MQTQIGTVKIQEETVDRQLRQIQTRVTQEDSLSKKWSDTEPEDGSLFMCCKFVKWITVVVIVKMQINRDQIQNPQVVCHGNPDTQQYSHETSVISQETWMTLHNQHSWFVYGMFRIWFPTCKPTTVTGILSLFSVTSGKCRDSAFTFIVHSSLNCGVTCSGSADLASHCVQYKLITCQV
jgi:hypothetical protein